MCYAIAFRRRHNSVQDQIILHDGLPSLEYAREVREVSGDLVVYSETGYIVADRKWLWSWELADEKSYAQRAIKGGV